MNFMGKDEIDEADNLGSCYSARVGQIGKSELTPELQQNILGKVNSNRSSIRFVLQRKEVQMVFRLPADKSLTRDHTRAFRHEDRVHNNQTSTWGNYFITPLSSLIRGIHVAFEVWS